MADLTSCYFCDAIDESVEEHPLIPEGLDPPADRQRTVAVCPSCSRKLDRAMEPMIEYLGDRAGRDLATGNADFEDATNATDPETISSTSTGDADVGSPGDDPDIEAGEEDEPVELPEAAHDVLRLLRNRAFPIDRSEIESVAESAYELGPRESSEAIDALVARGVLEEEDGRLDRPD